MAAVRLPTLPCLLSPACPRLCSPPPALSYCILHNPALQIEVVPAVLLLCSLRRQSRRAGHVELRVHERLRRAGRVQCARRCTRGGRCAAGLASCSCMLTAWPSLFMLRVLFLLPALLARARLLCGMWPLTSRRITGKCTAENLENIDGTVTCKTAAAGGGEEA